MKRSIVALVLALAFAAAARSEDPPNDDWKWDPAKRWKPAAGQRRVCEGETSTKTSDTATIPGIDQPYTEQEEETTSFKAVFEVVSVSDDGQVSEERVTFERWRQTTPDQDAPDTSLTKKCVHLTGAGKDRTYSIEGGDASPASAGAKKWIDSHLVARDQENDRDGYRRFLGPQEPIAPNGKWTGDAAVVASGLFSGVEIDPKRSSVTGKLGAVHVKDGVHMGHWEAKAVLHLKKSPSGVEWQDALQEMTVSVDGSLELDKSPAEDWKTDLKFTGKGEVKGKDAGKLEQRAQVSIKAKEGGVEKKP